MGVVLHVWASLLDNNACVALKEQFPDFMLG